MVFTREEAAVRAQLSKTNEPLMCQKWTRTMFGAPSVGDVDRDGDADAVDGWLSEPKAARHPGDRNPPRGVPVAWSKGSGNGHRAVSLGNGKVRSTDAGGRGKVATVDLGWVEKNWGHTYLGWTETISGIHIPTDAQSIALPVDLIDLSHWNTVTAAGVRAAMKAGINNYCLKVTESVDFVDNKYTQYRKTIEAQGAKTSAYHFARPRRSNGTVQAKFFLSKANITPGKNNKVMLDLEDNGGLSKAALTKWVGEFTREVERVLGSKHFIYTPFDLNDNFGWGLWVARYHPTNARPRVCKPWSNWQIRQFSNGVVGIPSDVPGFEKVDLNNVVGSLDKLKLPAKKKPPKPPVVVIPPRPKNAVDFRVHLLPGNGHQTSAQVKRDILLAGKVSGSSALILSTERSSKALRDAVSDALAKGWTRVINNANTVSYGPNWTAKARPTALLLAKEDPSKAKVSPSRYLNRVSLENRILKDATIKVKNTHLVSEANCPHVNVYGRKWREKTWKIQLNDVLNDVEKDFKAGYPQVLAGDFNTGVKFNGAKLRAELVKRFGKHVTHVFNGKLDHIILIGTPEFKMEELGHETLRNNTSDHNMVTATVRVTKL